MDAFIQSIGKMFDVLFSNIGKKLQVFAKVYIGVSFLSMVSVTLYCLIQLGRLANDYYGVDMEDILDISGSAYILGCIVFMIATLVVSWLLYAFGQLVDDVHQNRSTQHQLDDNSINLPKL